MCGQAFEAVAPKEAPKAKPTFEERTARICRPPPPQEPSI